jgi:proline dehydrogenase
LEIDIDLAFENASALAQAAREAGIEIMIGAEGFERTNAIFDLHRRLCECYDNVGITIQAYLYRSVSDMVPALDRPGKIRLVKGTYEEPSDVVRHCKEAIDSAYREFLETLLVSGHSCSIASHDPALLDHAHRFIQEFNFNKELIEFEMLYGVAMDRLHDMLRQGYRSRVYIPYGQEWYRYVCHRMAEYPPNIYRALTDAAGNIKWPTDERG